MEQDGASRIGRDRGKCSIMNTHSALQVQKHEVITVCQPDDPVKR